MALGTHISRGHGASTVAPRRGERDFPPHPALRPPSPQGEGFCIAIPWLPLEGKLSPQRLMRWKAASCALLLRCANVGAICDRPHAAHLPSRQEKQRGGRTQFAPTNAQPYIAMEQTAEPLLPSPTPTMHIVRQPHTQANQQRKNHAFLPIFASS